ncbi:alginate O-acetyltransferase AlgX-related protein [Spirosoma arcticum]
MSLPTGFDNQLPPAADAPPRSDQELFPKRFRFICTAIGFVGLLWLPMLDQWLDLSASFKSTEKRILTPLPTFHFPHVRTFVSQFNLYYKENFGWRNALFYQYSQWKFKGLGVSPLPDKVVIGKNGWFFPGNSHNMVVDQYRGLRTLSPTTLESIGKRLTYYEQALAKQGTRLYVLIAPDSYTIYPENVPDYLKTRKAPSNFDLLKSHLAQHTSIQLIDLRYKLRAAKAINVSYCQTDTHWNDFGSLIASMGLAERVRQDFPQVPDPRLANYSIRPKRGSPGDLVFLLALNQEIVDSTNYQIEPAAHLRIKALESIPNPITHLPTQRFVTANKTAPKLFLIGDSFTYSMNQFVPSYFRETFVTRDPQLDLRQVRTERPDVVVIEIVERNIDLLKDL